MGSLIKLFYKVKGISVFPIHVSDDIIEGHYIFFSKINFINLILIHGCSNDLTLKSTLL